jgi:purine-binding chemotaxis protein CheW
MSLKCDCANAGQGLPTPEKSTALNIEHLIGPGTINQRMIILIGIGRLMSSEEMDLTDNLAA